MSQTLKSKIKNNISRIEMEEELNKKESFKNAKQQLLGLFEDELKRCLKLTIPFSKLEVSNSCVFLLIPNFEDVCSDLGFIYDFIKHSEKFILTVPPFDTKRPQTTVQKRLCKFEKELKVRLKERKGYLISICNNFLIPALESGDITISNKGEDKKIVNVKYIDAKIRSLSEQENKVIKTFFKKYKIEFLGYDDKKFLWSFGYF